MRQGCFSGSISVDKILIEGFQLKKDSVGFIGDRVNEIFNGVRDFRYNSFKLFGWVK